MPLAELSLAALVLAIIVSCVSEMNVGILALALAWIVGVYIGGMGLNEVIGAFPVQLFLMLVGVTLLFSQAQLNGTLERVAHGAVRLCRGNVGLIPVMFFFLGCGIASLGPGNVSTAAMLAPVAMAVASRAAVPAFLMAIMVGNGAQAGSLSPFAPTGIIVNGIMENIGLGGNEFWNYWTNLAAHAAVAFGGYLLLGGMKLFRREFAAPATETKADHGLTRAHWITMGTILAVIAAVLFANANIGMAAFTGAVFLAVLRVADHQEAVRKIPWTPIIMVTGVTVLISLLERTGGLDLFTAVLARFASQESVTGVLAFLTGVISVYSSTSGVVLPAFLPTIPGLITRLGGGDPLALAASMNIGAHLVDMSPLSTTGAMCMAGITNPEEIRPTYNRLLAWGLSMSIVGGIFCFLFF
ncbi:MAG: SLC13 family permease [Vicinamibacterales bacterium]